MFLSITKSVKYFFFVLKCILKQLAIFGKAYYRAGEWKTKPEPVSVLVVAAMQGYL